jgi:carbonic anhydrase
MNRLFKLTIGILLLVAATLPGIGQRAETAVTSDSALAELKAGNEHHARHQYQHPHENEARQRELTGGQHPHAEILSCADSRVPRK